MRYRRSTLQLLPGMERPTYAGVKVDVLEGLDGQLIVEHEGQLIPSQEAPPRPNILRGVNGYPSHAPPYRNGLGSRWVRVLASLSLCQFGRWGGCRRRRSEVAHGRKLWGPLNTGTEASDRSLTLVVLLGRSRTGR